MDVIQSDCLAILTRQPVVTGAVVLTTVTFVQLWMVKVIQLWMVLTTVIFIQLWIVKVIIAIQK